MVDILNNPISHLVIGEEWLVKLINHLESNIGDNTKSSTSNASEFKSLFRYIEKIIAIFEEIESDLIHTENKIQETRKIVNTLAHQFGRIGRFCLSEIPNVVQKEHDQASNNLTALRWNIKKTQEEYNKISTRLKSLTATKKSIESEISQLTGCTSLVNEKSLITEAELKEIIDRTIEVTETLAKMNAKLNETQIHYNAVKRKSEEIRTNLALDVSKAEQNLIDAQNKLKNVIEIEPKLIEETVNMKNKIESLKLHIQTLSNTVKDYQQTFNQLKQQLIELNKNYTNQQILSENLFQWIKENEENLINQFNGKLINEINQLNQLLHNKSEKYYQIKMNEIELQTENDRCEKRILD
ncbi:spindle assembly checkpoint component MAD1 (Mitotic arrest deficient 1) [Schistosoma japonicum]|nr:spindle assembly checkpoint component MAD1 (Mitotic arrest deficient 1) [Schistosoma japonicum]